MRRHVCCLLTRYFFVYSALTMLIELQTTRRDLCLEVSKIEAILFGHTAQLSVPLRSLFGEKSRRFILVHSLVDIDQLTQCNYSVDKLN